jgi:hypothetical protein
MMMTVAAKPPPQISCGLFLKGLTGRLVGVALRGSRSYSMGLSVPMVECVPSVLYSSIHSATVRRA